jgi:hypothetical protein
VSVVSSDEAARMSNGRALAISNPLAKVSEQRPVSCPHSRENGLPFNNRRASRTVLRIDRSSLAAQGRVILDWTSEVGVGPPYAISPDLFVKDSPERQRPCTNAP